jgi:hypothetical protein
MPRRLTSLLCLCVAGLLAFSPITSAQEAPAKKSYIDVGAGIIFGSNYRDALKENNPDWTLSGGSGWVYVDVGFLTKVGDRLYIGPRVGLAALFIEYESVFHYSGVNSKKVTFVVLPGVTAKFDLTPKMSTPFVAGDLSLVSASSDIDEPKLGSGGIAMGGTVGYSINHRIEFALTYRYIPVKMNDDKTSNFGGIGFIARTAFGL